jgi:hypothetical protein
VQRALLSLLLVWSCCAAHAGERPGDIAAVDELRKRAQAATATQRQLLAIAESAPRDEQFELYRAHDATVGAWLQVGFLRALLDASIAARSAADERRVRAELRDYARFAVWEFDQSIADLDASIARSGRADFLRLLKRLRVLAIAARTAALRLAGQR